MVSVFEAAIADDILRRFLEEHDDDGKREPAAARFKLLWHEGLLDHATRVVASKLELIVALGHEFLVIMHH